LVLELADNLVGRFENQTWKGRKNMTAVNKRQLVAKLTMVDAKMSGLAGDLGFLAEQAHSASWADGNVKTALEHIIEEVETKVLKDLKSALALVSVGGCSSG
jgi:hypothetical protein